VAKAVEISCRDSEFDVTEGKEGNGRYPVQMLHVGRSMSAVDRHASDESVSKIYCLVV
jgi:hypothetical protein